MKKLSCGGLIFAPSGEFFIVRPRWDSPSWNIPKGELQDGETYKDCAFREIEEETGIKPSIYQSVKDLGLFPYLKSKDVYLFYIVLNQKPTKFVCNSFYQENGKTHPENVDFKWIDWNDRYEYVSIPIQNLLKLVSPKIKI